jgi:hypothetical protein
MKWLDRWLFPRGEFLNFAIIATLSGAISFLLIGRQIYQADWGLVDDHEVFLLPWAQPSPISDRNWSTLLAKTEVGSLQGRFRPGYYIFKLIETSLWGANVHLWYLARAIEFAIFLGSIWWFMRRFVGVWLSGVLTAYISLLPLWAGIWSRLGPSEIYGATCIGIMAFSAYFIFFSDSHRIRTLSAITLTLATVGLVSVKETFVPLAGGTAAVFIWAGVKGKLSPLAVVVLVLIAIAALAGIVAVVIKEVLVSGTDYYANPVGIWPVFVFASKGFVHAILRTWWLIVIPIVFLRLLNVIPRKPLINWITDSGVAIAAYGFLVATYALQSALYRTGFPLNIRYDFPAMLLVPLTCCVLACDVSCKIREFHPKRTINYAELAAAAFLFFYLALGPAYLDSGKPLSVAVQTNIETTNSFYSELQRTVREAEKSPESPIILEAYGPGAFEPVYSLSYYLPALGARNRISVRLHPEEKSQGKLYDGLQQGLSNLEQSGSNGFIPLRENLANHPQRCISIGINGAADVACAGFQVKTP